MLLEIVTTHFLGGVELWDCFIVSLVFMPALLIGEVRIPAVMHKGTAQAGDDPITSMASLPRCFTISDPSVRDAADTSR